MEIPTSAAYLDRLLKQSSITNDRRLRYDSDIAGLIGVSRSTLSQYRSGRNMSVLIAVKIADLLGINPMEPIAATMTHQAKTNEERIYWMNCYEKYKS